MAGCDINRGLNILACKNTVAGIRKVFLANWDDYDFVTQTNASGHTLSDLGSLSGDTIFEYEVKNDGNSWSETVESSRDAGTTVFNQVTTAVMTKLTAEKQYQLKLMAWGRLLVFIEFQSGDVLLSGLENGCEATYVGNVEGAMTGANAYTVTFTGMEREPAYFLTSNAVTQLLNNISSDNMSA
jgi:hypothetical protein